MPVNIPETVEDLESVEEKHRTLYQEVEEGDDAGKYVLRDDVKPLVGDYVSTSKQLEETRKTKKEASDEAAKRRHSLKAFEQIMEDLGIEEDSRSADGLKAYIEEVAAKAKNGEELKVDLDKVRQEMKANHQKELEAKDQEIQMRDKALERHLISDQATRAIANAKGSVELLLPHVREHCKMVRDDSGEYSVRVVDEQGDVRYGGDGEPLTIDGLVEEMKTRKDYARAFESEAPSGTGAEPGSASRPGSGPARRSQDRPKSSVEKISAGLEKRQSGRR